MNEVLTAEKLNAGYSRRPVVRDLNLAVGEGEVCALLGANGAGKSTTLLALAGELPPLSGEVGFLGKVTRAPLYRRARSGLAYVPEEHSIFSRLTVADNLRVGKADSVYALSLFPELERLMSRRAGLLSGGERQMLTLARALGRRPKVLLIDEMSLGLAPLIVLRLLSVVHKASKEDGVAVLLVEQHVRQAMSIADHALVLRRGEVVMSGTALELGSRLSEIETAYLSS